MDEQYRKDFEYKVMCGKDPQTAAFEARGNYNQRLSGAPFSSNQTPSTPLFVPPVMPIGSSTSYSGSSGAGSGRGRPVRWRVPIIIFVVWMLGWLFVDDPALVRVVYKQVTGHNLEAPAFMRHGR